MERFVGERRRAVKCPERPGGSWGGCTVQESFGISIYIYIFLYMYDVGYIYIEREIHIYIQIATIQNDL